MFINPHFGMLGLGGSEILLLLVGVPFGLACLIFWAWMLIDCANHEPETGMKVAWILIILFANCIGAPLYFFFRKLPRQNPRS